MDSWKYSTELKREYESPFSHKARASATSYAHSTTFGLSLQLPQSLNISWPEAPLKINTYRRNHGSET